MRRLSFPWLVPHCLVLFAIALPVSLAAQQVTLHARTSLVLVPTLVESKTCEPVFNLEARDFLVKDNGVKQKIHLDPDMDKTPMSIVVLVQVGGSAIRGSTRWRICRSC
jgi:hypothetical protein